MIEATYLRWTILGGYRGSWGAYLDACEAVTSGDAPLHPRAQWYKIWRRAHDRA